MPYRLLTEFQNLFDAKQYRHRSSTAGDFVAIHLYEDLVTLDKSVKLKGRAMMVVGEDVSVSLLPYKVARLASLG